MLLAETVNLGKFVKSFTIKPMVKKVTPAILQGSEGFCHPNRLANIDVKGLAASQKVFEAFSQKPRDSYQPAFKHHMHVRQYLGDIGFRQFGQDRSSQEVEDEFIKSRQRKAPCSNLGSRVRLQATILVEFGSISISLFNVVYTFYSPPRLINGS